MPNWLRELDDLLRGRKSRPELLAQGTEHLRVGPHVGMSLLLGALYGLSMALYAVIGRRPPVHEQLLASAIKVPALFFLTLLVSFPSLCAFSAVLNSRLGPRSALRVSVAAITVNLAVLASFAPITAFFTLTTTSYHFMKLLNALFLAASGVVALGFLMRMLRHLEEAQRPEQAAPEAEAARPGGWADAPSPSASRRLFKAWVVLYALVGVQMAWLLRPFIGAPDLPFAWFRQRGGNAFLDLLNTFEKLLGR